MLSPIICCVTAGFSIKLTSISIFSRVHLPCALIFLPAMMDGEVARAEVKKMIRRDTAAVRAIALRVTGSLITTVLLLWTICSEVEIATKT
jgi:hypothetical protein